MREEGTEPRDFLDAEEKIYTPVGNFIKPRLFPLGDAQPKTAPFVESAKDRRNNNYGERGGIVTTRALSFNPFCILWRPLHPGFGRSIGILEMI